jgi:hypothetical protein
VVLEALRLRIMIDDVSFWRVKASARSISTPLSGYLRTGRPDRNLGSWKYDTSIPLAYRLDLVAQLLNEKPRGALLATPIDLPARGVNDDLLAI